MEDIWKSWTEVRKLCKDKIVVLWGRSDDWIPKVLKKIEANYIIDSNPAYNDTEFKGLSVYLPDELKKFNKDNIYIIITGAVYESISNDLDELGYIAGKHYCCNPDIKDWAILQEIREYDKNIIIACSDYKDKSKKRYSQMGGGIYTYNTKTNELKKHLEGNYRQIIKVNEYYYVVEFVKKEIHKLSKRLQLLEVFNIDPCIDEEKPNACGIAYHPKTEQFFVSNSGSDHINIYDKDFRWIDDIQLSDKFSKYGDGQHHINDICIMKNRLLVSCFSITGNWKDGVMDGGILSYDIYDTDLEPEILVNGLWMPHSVEYINGDICYLNSMKGELWVGTQKIEGIFPGLVRGLTYDDRFYYIGLSEDMYVSRLFGVKDNIMCNAGVFLFDIDTKVSRFYSFPFIMNVHDILIGD